MRLTADAAFSVRMQQIAGPPNTVKPYAGERDLVLRLVGIPAARCAGAPCQSGGHRERSTNQRQRRPKICGRSLSAQFLDQRGRRDKSASSQEEARARGAKLAVQ